MIPVISTIAVNTFRETIRDRILLIILLFALGFSVISGIVSQWSLNQEAKILQDFGFTTITAFGLIIAIFIGVELVYKEIDKRTIYNVLSKPISRAEFIIGKYFGLLLTLFVNFLLMGAGFVILYWLFTGVVHLKLIPAIGMIFLQMSVMVAIVLFFSAFTSPLVSTVLSLFTFLAGNISADIYSIGSGVKNALFVHLLQAMYYIFPNFSLLNIQTQVVHDLKISIMSIMIGIIYSIVYSALLLVIINIIFKRRDLK